MKFTVYSSAYMNPDDERLLRDYPVLKNYNYREGSIEIKTIEELMRLSTEVGHPFVIGNDEDPANPELEIYDDWRE